MTFFLAAFLLLATIAAPIEAQWLHYPTAGVPQTRSGKPNLAAPAPRADGHPDLSGMWWNAGNELPCPPDIRGDDGECIEKGLGLGDTKGSGLPRQAVNIADGLAGGLPYQPGRQR